MRRFWLQMLLLIGAVCPAFGAEYAYVNSRGERISLQAVEGAALTRLDPAVRRRLEIPAAVNDWRGKLFSVPGTNAFFTLERGLIIKMKRPAARLPADLVTACGLQESRPLGNSGRMFLARAADAGSALAAATLAVGRSDVEWAVPDFAVPLKLYRVPADPYYSRQWYLQQASGACIQAESAWDVTMGDPRVVVAVIDTGVDVDHPDFSPERITEGYNAADDSVNISPGSRALDGHGTACSGEIVARADNAEGMVGVCPNCSLMPIKMMDGESTLAQLSTGYRAISHATASGAWVLSNSWGIDEDLTAYVDMQPYYDAVRDAVENGRGGLGAVVVFAAGNGNDNTGQAEPIGEHEIQNMPEALVVGGTGPDDTVVAYSDYGSNLSVVAPTGTSSQEAAENILTTDTLGDRGFSRSGTFWVPVSGADQNTGLVEPDTTGNYTAYFRGTSAACPIAAGVVALVLSAAPELTGAQARLIVEQTADKVGGVSYDQQGWHQRYGFGRVNAARAVYAARAGFEQPDGAPCAADLNCLTGGCALLIENGYEGYCGRACEGPEACADTETCTNLPGGVSICLPSCERHWDCAPDELCLDDACRRIQCGADDDCPEGAFCPDTGSVEACKPACTLDGDCSAPALCLAYAFHASRKTCQSIPCQDADGCPEGTACAPGGSHCLRQCDWDEDCLPEQLCVPSENAETLCRIISCESSAGCPETAACGDAGFCEREGEIQVLGSCGCDVRNGSAGGMGFTLPVLLCLAVWWRTRRLRS